VATLILERGYKRFDDVQQVCTDFYEKYGLKIPYQPMSAILGRARHRGLLMKSEGKFVPVPDVLVRWDMTSKVADQERNITQLVTALCDHAVTKHKVALTSEQAEEALVAYMSLHDLDVLFATQASSVLPEVRSTRSTRHIVNSFAKHICATSSGLFKQLVDMAIGHVLACAILYDVHALSGKLTGVHLYFDTGVLLRLVGAEGPAREAAYKEFARLVRTSGATLHVFNHTYDEVMGVLNHCRIWVERGDYDPSLANLALRRFVEEGARASDVEAMMARVPGVLESHGITTQALPIAPSQQTFQVDEAQLKNLIVEEYKKYRQWFQEAEREFTIARDVNSISAVHRLRCGQPAHTMGSAGHAFVTCNSTLAYAAKRFEHEVLGLSGEVPAVLTDTFIGTALWLQSPIESSGLSAKRLVAECSAALQPDAQLVGLLVRAARKLLDKGDITQDEFYVLRGSRVAHELLADKTLADPDNFTEKTVLEILEEIRREYAARGEVKLQEERVAHERTKSERDDLMGTLKDGAAARGKMAERIAGIVATATFVFAATALLVLLVGLQFTKTANNTVIRVSSLLLLAILAFVGFIRRSNLLDLRCWLKEQVRAWLLRKLP
jgi:hypothetical protein